VSDGHAKKEGDIPSRVLFMLVNGSRASLISRTTFVFLSMTGKIRVNLAMCPGYHDFGGGTRTPAIPGAQTTSRVGEGRVEVIIFSNGRPSWKRAAAKHR